MNAQQIQERFAGHPFIDYFDCLTAALEAAKKRNKQAVRAKLAGEIEQQSYHLGWRRYYMQRVRQWHAMIDWSPEE